MNCSVSQIGSLVSRGLSGEHPPPSLLPGHLDQEDFLHLILPFVSQYTDPDLAEHLHAPQLADRVRMYIHRGV